MRYRALLGAAAAGLLALNLIPTLPASAASDTSRDPALGPHARDEARHRADVLHFLPAHSRPIPRQPHGASSVVPAAQLEGPIEVVAAPPAVDGPALATPAAITATHGGLTREVLGFAPYWALPANGNWNYSLLTTLAYFGLDMDRDGNFNTQASGWPGWTSQNLVDMINRAHLAGDRVVVVIKAFDEATINDIVTRPTATQNGIQHAIDAISSKSLDGVNVDFEGYASSSYPNIQSGFTNFMTQLSQQVHQKWPTAMVSVDTYSGAASWDNGLFNIGALAPAVDAFFIMAYDMNFSNLPGQAGPNAPVNGWTYNDTTSVAQYLSKAPASKIILGVPYYGYKYSVTTPQSQTPPPYAQTSGSATADTYSGVLDDFACGALQLSKQWDDTAQSPWASWWSPATNDPCGGNHNSWRELYYDDARSLGFKYDLVNTNNLLGTGMWALGYDGTSTDLWNELALKFTPTLDAGPDVASWASGRLDVVGHGSDGALWHRAFSSGRWSTWEFLGGHLASAPTAVSWGPGRLDVFARGTDNTLWHRFYDISYLSGWSAWESLGGNLASAPDVASWGWGRLDVFARAPDGTLGHRFFDRSYVGGWSGWEALGGSFVSDPGVVSWAQGRLDVFARTADNSLTHRFYDRGYIGGWSAWENLGGSFSSSADPSSWAQGRLDVFGRAADGTLVHRFYDRAYVGGWSAWESLGGQLTEDPGAVSWGYGRIDVVARAANADLLHRFYDRSTGWSSWEDLGGL